MKQVRWLDEIDIESENYGKHSKFIAQLLQADFPLPYGYIITKDAYFDFLEKNNLAYKIKQILSTISLELADSVMQGEYHIKNLFKESSLPDSLIQALSAMNSEMSTLVSAEIFETGKQGKKHKKISSIVSRKLPEEIINLWAEMFSAKVLWNRHQLGSDHFQNGAEIIVQEKITGDKTGIITTIEPITHEKNKLVITTSYPHDHDHYILSKKNLTILDRKLTYATNVHKLTSDEIALLGQTAKKIEEHVYFPQEISWVFDGPALFITDIKPVSTTVKQKVVGENRLPVARGKGVTSQITTGHVHIITKGEPHNITVHDIVIVSHLPSEKVKAYKKARGIIVESPLLADATTSLLKHFGIPSIANVKNASAKFRNGNIVTLHCEKGEIYAGGLL